MTASTIGTQQNQRDKDDERQWLVQNLNVNRMQQEVSAAAYAQMARDGNIAVEGAAVFNIANQGALAQAMSMHANRPVHATLTSLRRRVDAMQHPAGPSHTIVGDMNVHGRQTAADKRVTNNGLMSAYIPAGMTEEQQMAAVMQQSMNANATNDVTEDELMGIALLESSELAAGGGITQQPLTQSQLNSKMPAIPQQVLQATTHTTIPQPALHATAHATPMNSNTTESDDTPMFIVNTRNEVSKKRREKRRELSDKQRRVHVTFLCKNLSRPHNAAYVNELAAIKDLPTPERAEEMLEFTEDMMMD